MYDQHQHVLTFGAAALWVSVGVWFVALFPLYWWTRTRAQTMERSQGVGESSVRSKGTRVGVSAIQTDERRQDATELNGEEPIRPQMSRQSIAEFTRSDRDDEHNMEQSRIHSDPHRNAYCSSGLGVLGDPPSIAVSDPWDDEPDDDGKQAMLKKSVERQEKIVELATHRRKDEQAGTQNEGQRDQPPEVDPLESRPPLDLSGVHLLRTKTKVAVKASDLTIPVPPSIRTRKVRGHDSFYLCDLQTVFDVTLSEGMNLDEPVNKTKHRTTRKKLP
jgi:hypothetical protein